MTRRTERGAVTVLAVALLGMLVMLTGALGVAEAMITAHRRAQSAADLAALAAARAIQRSLDPCQAAATIAKANGATVEGCEVASPDVAVTTRVRGPRWLGAHGDLEARARAGPDPG